MMYFSMEISGILMLKIHYENNKLIEYTFYCYGEFGKWFQKFPSQECSIDLFFRLVFNWGIFTQYLPKREGIEAIQCQHNIYAQLWILFEDWLHKFSSTNKQTSLSTLLSTLKQLYRNLKNLKGMILHG